MSSIFARPDSPPPRAPSPDFVPTALPSPPMPNRRSRSGSRTPRSQHSSLAVSSLPNIDRSLFAARSCGNLRELSRAGSWDTRERTLRKPSSLRMLEVSPPSTPRSLPLPSPTRSTHSSTRSRRTLSNAIPYRSPPASPTIASPPPPVPPVPALLLTPSDKKPMLRPQSTRLSPIHLAELESLPTDSQAPPSFSRKRRTSVAPRDNKSLGMTCLKFFSMRNSHQRAPHAVSV
ncbi:hypothetical protein HGRIS_009480 [Hohenbuehelia grisea]|uniref:Uncharacterized protein n=1 Tax=Hohenbuehelia grisea TaxID=104357 RepID=A0ABR3J1G4_9AGAR